MITFRHNSPSPGKHAQGAVFEDFGETRGAVLTVKRTVRGGQGLPLHRGLTRTQRLAMSWFELKQIMCREPLQGSDAIASFAFCDTGEPLAIALAFLR